MKKLNIEMNAKFDLQLRRKVSNLISESILLNYSENLEDIEECEYNLCLSKEYIQNQINEIDNLIGPENIKNEYANNLKKKYTEIVELLHKNSNKEKENICKGVYDWNKLKEKNKNVIQFYNLTEDKNEILKAIVLNLFFIIRKIFSLDFNDSIHNRLKQMNHQILNELEKFKNANNNFRGVEKIQENEKENKIFHEKSAHSSNDKKILCTEYYKEIDYIKRIYKIKENAIIDEQMKKFLSSLNNKDKEKLIICTIDELKKYLDDMKKSYELKDNITLINAFNIFVKGDKLTAMKEALNFENKSKINEILETFKGKNEEDEIEECLNEINSSLEKNLNKILSLKNKIYEDIKIYSKYIDLSSIINNDSSSIEFNPFEIVDEIEMDSSEITKVEQTYYFLLINLYFCYHQYAEYFNIIKEKIKKLGIKEIKERNIIKNKLVEITKQNIANYNGDNDELNLIWKSLKYKNKFVNNESLNKKIKEYIKNNSSEDFQQDFNEILGEKIHLINLNQKDPQDFIIKFFMKQKKFYIEIPKELKYKH